MARVSRRSLFQWAIGVAAGTVLARMPLAGFLGENPLSAKRNMEQIEVLFRAALRGTFVDSDGAIYDTTGPAWKKIGHVWTCPPRPTWEYSRHVQTPA